MRLDLSQVRFSYKDKEKGIVIPNKLTPELAEDIGIHIGDGSLYRCNSKRTSFEFSYASNTEEQDYLSHIISLKKRIYNLNKFRIERSKKEKELNLRFNSLAIETFYTNTLKIPAKGKLYTAKVPKIIKNSKDPKIISSFIRGVVDTDFYFRYIKRNNDFYPVLQGRFASPNLIKGLKDLFDLLKIKNKIQLYKTKPDKRFKKSWITHIISIYGHKNFNLYLQMAGFNNPKNIKKIKMVPTGFEPAIFSRN